MAPPDVVHRVDMVQGAQDVAENDLAVGEQFRFRQARQRAEELLVGPDAVAHEQWQMTRLGHGIASTWGSAGRPRA
jgi:hypothetical protein